MPRAATSVRRTQGILGGRSEQVVRRVLDAALVELGRSGYAGFRMDEVARRAAVNKTSIYRRWPSREALVSALVNQMRLPLRQRALPDTGNIEHDLVEAFSLRFEVSRTVEGRAWARLLSERHINEVDAMVGSVVDGRRDEWRSMVTRAVSRGELPPETDARLVLDFIRAIVDSRKARGLSSTWLILAVRTVLTGARLGTLVRGGVKRDKTIAVTKRRKRQPAGRGIS